MNDTAIRNDSLFGGIAWHGYGGDVSEQTTVHNQFPSVHAFDTEHSGGTWIANQQNEDMNNIISYTRNWGNSVTKWSLAVDQNMGPHNGGCGTCTGLITVHNGDSRSGQVDYTVEYYDMGQLTKFVKPGAFRIDSTANANVPNVAWKNPDGSKALVAYNGTGSRAVGQGGLGQRVLHLQPAGRDLGDLHLDRHPGQRRHRRTPARSPATAASASTSPAPTPPTARRSSSTPATAPARRPGPSAPTAPSGRSASAWTWPRPAPPTAPRSSCTTATAPAPRSGSASGTQLINPAPASAWTPPARARADGTPLQIWACSGGANQQWTLP